MLFKKIKKLTEEFNGEVGIVIKYLENGKEIKINEDNIFPSASIIKLTILWELFNQVEMDNMELSDEVRIKDEYKVGGCGVLQELHSGISLTLEDLAKLMIILSDNTATNMLIDKLGIEKINRSIQNLGMKNTVLQRKMMDEEAKKKGNDNYTTAGDVANIFQKFLYSDKLGKSKRYEIIEILKKQQFNNKLPLFMPTNIVFAHKTGDLPEIEHDGGILFFKKNTIIIVVLTKNLKSNFEGIKLNNDIGKIVFEYFNTILK